MPTLNKFVEFAIARDTQISDKLQFGEEEHNLERYNNGTSREFEVDCWQIFI